MAAQSWVSSILSKLVGEPIHKTQLQVYQENTLALKEKVYTILVKIEGDLKELRAAVETNNVVEKNAKTSELENKFILLKGKSDSIMDKLRLITRTEGDLDDIVAINDEQPLNDKINQVKTMSEVSREMQQLLAHNPSIKEYKQEALDRLYKKVNTLIGCVNKITADDERLMSTYKRLQKL
jgi:predicted glutamine amidotransferase